MRNLRRIKLAQAGCVHDTRSDMKTETDIYGRSHRDAAKIFNCCRYKPEIKLVSGVWLARWLYKSDSWSSRRGAFRLQVMFSAIDREGQVISNGTRRDTIAMALRQHKH